MRAPRARFTIRSLMIAVMIVAGLLALPDGWREVAAVLSLPCIALVTAGQLLLRGHRHLAGVCFWVLAIPANILTAAYCAFPDGYFSILLWGSSLFVVLPTLAGFGVTWAILSTQVGVVPRRFPWVIWLSVIALAVMPVVTSWTLWPFRLVFVRSRPALERLANQVAAGQAIGSPQWAGPFQVAGSAVDPATGDIALLIDPDPNGPTGFVRDMGGRSVPGICGIPIRGDKLHVWLGGGWCYHEED